MCSQSIKQKDSEKCYKTKLMAFLGLLFLSGVKRARHTNFRDLWATDGSGIEFFRACMSYNRFRFLLSAVRFDDKSNRNQKKRTDKLAAIRFILDEFVKNCKSTYCLNEFFTIEGVAALYSTCQTSRKSTVSRYLHFVMPKLFSLET